MTPKPRRRPHGTGGVYQRASDGLFVATIEAGWTTKGTRRRITVSAKTKKAAETKLKEKQRQIAREGLPTEGVSSRTTVKAWSETWLVELARHARPKYFATEQSSVKQWIIPTIGHKPLATLTPADVRAVTNAARKAGRSTTTAGYAQGVLTRMLKSAIVEGHPVPQRVLLVPAPGKSVSDRTDIDLTDALALLAVAADMPDGSRWVAAFLQGLRQAEALGLTWPLVDLAAGVQDIAWQLQPLPYLDRAAGTFRVPDGYEARHLTGAFHLTRPKSKSGSRVQPLVPWMTGTLAAWHRIAPVSPHGLVWPRADGRPRTAAADREQWYAMQEKAGVQHPAGRPYLIHEIRHTTATLLLELGVDPKVIVAIMGHSSITTTRGYQHVKTAQAREALEQVAERLGLGQAPRALDA